MNFFLLTISLSCIHMAIVHGYTSNSLRYTVRNIRPYKTVLITKNILLNRNWNSYCSRRRFAIDSNKAGEVNSVGTIGKLSRIELQQLAKNNGIKANIKSSEIIQQLTNKYETASTRSMTGSKSRTMKDKIVSDKESAIVKKSSKIIPTKTTKENVITKENASPNKKKIVIEHCKSW